MFLASGPTQEQQLVVPPPQFHLVDSETHIAKIKDVKAIVSSRLDADVGTVRQTKIFDEQGN